MRKYASAGAVLGRASALALCATVALGCGPAGAAPLGVVSALGQPAGPAVQSVGGVVTAAGQGHAGIAPTVYGTAPALEPFADSVTNGLVGVGQGLKATGGAISSGGLVVTPIAGARTAAQTLSSGQLVEAHAGLASVGNSANPLISANALSSGQPKGSLATAGVANANGLLTIKGAPQ